MDQNVMTAIRAVVDYNWATERADYDRQDEAGRDRHVFRSLTTIARWLNGQADTTATTTTGNCEPEAISSADRDDTVVRSVPVVAGERTIGWKVESAGLLIGVVRPYSDADACTARVFLSGERSVVELGVFPTRNAAALAVITAHTLHGYPPTIRRDFLDHVGGHR